MRRIAIVGGAFDPIHNDHIKLGYGVTYMGLVDDVTYSPCYRHKFAKDMVSPEHRLAMTYLALEDGRKKYAVPFNVSPFEVQAKFEGSTYEYVTGFLKNSRLAHEEYYFVIGSDNAAQIEKFHRWQELIQEINFIVVRRNGHYASGNEWYLNKPHHYVDLQLRGLSSTIIRDAVKTHGYPAIVDMVPHSVYDYIIQHNLYK